MLFYDICLLLLLKIKIDSSSVKRFEQSQGLDTTLYMNVPLPFEKKYLKLRLQLSLEQVTCECVDCLNVSVQQQLNFGSANPKFI